MAKLYFKVGSDWEEVVRLRNEIVKLKQELMSMDGTQSPAAFKALNVQLAASNQRLDELVTNAAKAGAEMETGFKKGIYDGEKAVNSLSEEIIKQKDIIRETQNDVSMLTEQYKKLGKYDPKRQSLSDELNRAKAALGDKAEEMPCAHRKRACPLFHCQDHAHCRRSHDRRMGKGTGVHRTRRGTCRKVPQGD